MTDIILSPVYTPRSNEKEDKILFLDIDGVLHPQDAVYLLNSEYPPVGTELFRWCKLLDEHLKQFPEVKIVISSTWRLIFGFNQLCYFFPKEIRERIIDVTSNEEEHRWKAIVSYVRKHDVKNYVILDDDYKAFPYELPELVRCYPDKGISHEVTAKNINTHLKRICNKE